MKTVQVFKDGLSLFPYECELAAYEKDGWSTQESKPEVKTDKSEPKFKTTKTKEA